ncbi:hypothetical protein [Halorussus amylolyticus]|uniref:hypothetical protein n=1 Tax=Halorussus amylolyticus TaxID=1126242 RepID=UPI0010513847|nr:hypothetical protein [Halorussus amylolyticus]
MTADETLDEPPSKTEASDADESRATDDADDRSHLSDLADGSGCTEIWEHLSEQRERDADEE